MPAKRTSDSSRHPLRIVVTGGPGGGKTTAADLFRREIGKSVTLVPEAATLMFTSGFPRSHEPEAVKIIQRTIYHVQRDMEALYAVQNPGTVLLCDRGTVDGAAYWPGQHPHDFFHAQGTTLKEELDRYSAVLFFESAAVGGMMIKGGNPVRDETTQQAIDLDARLRALWSQHPRFVMVPHNTSFFKKISSGLAALESMVSQILHEHRSPAKAKAKPTGTRRKA
jgi:predicted ATPase